MTTKTFKFGEYAKGGVITAQITGKLVVIIGKEWDFSKGSKRSSDQSNAKEFTRGSVMANEERAQTKVYNFLTDLTTDYYAEQILKWIKTKINLRLF